MSKFVNFTKFRVKNVPFLGSKFWKFSWGKKDGLKLLRLNKTIQSFHTFSNKKIWKNQLRFKNLKSTNIYILNLIKHLLNLFLGTTILRSSVVMEKLGSWKSFCTKDGSQSGNHFRSGKEIEKEVAGKQRLFILFTTRH